MIGLSRSYFRKVVLGLFSVLLSCYFVDLFPFSWFYCSICYITSSCPNFFYTFGREELRGWPQFPFIYNLFILVWTLQQIRETTFEKPKLIKNYWMKINSVNDMVRFVITILVWSCKSYTFKLENTVRRMRLVENIITRWLYFRILYV